MQCVAIMTRDEYDKRKTLLDEQLRAGVELLQAAHRQQVRALDLVWMTRGEGDLNESALKMLLPEERPVAPPAPPPATQPPSRAPRRKAGELYEDVLKALANAPEVFDVKHIRGQLGEQADRGSIHRTLLELVGQGSLSIHSYGEGRVPTRYRKNGTGSGGTEA